MVKVDFATAIATIEDGEWSSDDTVLLGILSRLKPLYGISGAEPDRDLALARYAIDLIGGKILEADEPESEDGVIY